MIQHIKLFLVCLLVSVNVSCTGQSGNKTNPYYSHTETKKLNLTDDEWRKILPSDVYYIAREEGTERAYTGQYWDNHDQGLYFCRPCGNLLFKSETKFESGTGWPSFYQAASSSSVALTQDDDGYRTAVSCARCNAHLGHVFNDGPKPTGKRFCMNGNVLDFVAQK